MLADQLDAMFTASNVYITLWDETTGQAYLAASSRNVRPLISSMASGIDPEELSLVASALESGKPEFIEDLSQTTFVSQRIVSYVPDHSALVLPLIADSRRLGAVVIGFHEGQRIPLQEISLAEHAAAQIALTIARAQSLATEQKRSTQLERANSIITALGKVATRVQHAPDLESVLETLGTELDRLGFHSLVALRDGDDERLRIRYISLTEDAQAFLRRVGVLDIHTIPIDSPEFPDLQELVEKEDATFLTNPIKLVLGNLREPLASLSSDLFRLVGLTSRTRSISLPLQIDERVIGLLGLWSDTLEVSDVAAAMTFAAQVAIAIEKTRLMDEVQELAITDDLTHVYNRRALFEFGKREVDMALRFGRPLTALMVDGDWFKAINDTKGHLIGDQVLTALAERLRKAVRDVDIVGRYGGDEFVVLLVEVDLQDAMHVARRLLATINDQPFITDAGKTTLTISIGAAACVTETTSISDLIREADRALYIAKDAGRKRLATIQGVVM